MKYLARFFEGLRVARRFSSELAGHRAQLALVLVLFVSTIALELLRPWPLSWVIDRALLTSGPPPENAREIVLYCALALALILAHKALADYSAILRMTAVGHAVTRSLRLRIFRHLVELPPSFHAKNKSGDLLVRLLGDVAQVKELVVDASLQIGLRSAHAMGILAVMLFIDPVLALVVLVPLPILLFTVRFLSKRLTIAVRKQRRKEGEMANYMHEAISATDVLQSLGSGAQVVRQFAHTNRRNARAGLKTARASARLTGSVETLLALAFAAAVAFGGLRVLDGNLRAGELIVFLSYVRSMLKPLRAAAKHQGRIAKGAASGERILALLDEDIELRLNSGQLSPAAAPSSLVFEDVSYTYEDGSEALKQVSAEFRRGEITAIVGVSGAGKSTLVSLAMRLFDPTAGRVLFDGVNLTELDLDELRRSFRVSMQSTVLFGESIRQNLLLAVPDASDDDLWRALAEAELESRVRALPDGLETVLGASGVGLSGGESRRLCCARALLGEAPILIIDEPFAGLDPGTAGRLARVLETRREGRIVIVITHQLEHLGSVQRIYALEDGKIHKVVHTPSAEERAS